MKKELLWGMEFSAAQTVLSDLGVPTSKGLPSPLPSTRAEKSSLARRLVLVCICVCECVALKPSGCLVCCQYVVLDGDTRFLGFNWKPSALRKGAESNNILCIFLLEICFFACVLSPQIYFSLYVSILAIKIVGVWKQRQLTVVH